MYKDFPYPGHLNATIRSINNEPDVICCVEMHHNASINKNVRGGMAIYWDTSKKGKLLSDAIAFQMNWMPVFQFSPFKKYWKERQHYHYQAGSLATLIHIKRRLAFLKQTEVPACIVEPAYISNAEDLEFAKKNVKYIARAIKSGIMVWIKAVA